MNKDGDRVVLVI